MRTQTNRRLKTEEPKVECDRCGFTFYEGELVEQDGLMVCAPPKGHCLDEPSYQDYKEGVR